MHKVKRNNPPKSLKGKNRQWLHKLEIDHNLNHDWECLSRSTKIDIQNSLRNMYKGCCCYCESIIEHTSFMNIEHFKPKSKYKSLCYEYSNLHYCCTVCNNRKRSTFNELLISPTEDNPELYIKYIGGTAKSIDNNERGIETINVLDLNRNCLKDVRSKIIKEIENEIKYIIKIIEFAKESNDKQTCIEIISIYVNKIRDDIKNKSSHGSNYCTMIKHNFDTIFDKLKDELEILN
jgi:uncharacterized protein (TIGR02646 family)